ncbi:hypothetical protein Sjap_000433 [Stephania japonica]|uniref:Uncharacterized protein n=1 Tax=Stephania japonica TaxID=461633 RepID=A0AAP0KI03_9MAGN
MCERIHSDANRRWDGKSPFPAGIRPDGVGIRRQKSPSAEDGGISPTMRGREGRGDIISKNSEGEESLRGGDPCGWGMGVENFLVRNFKRGIPTSLKVGMGVGITFLPPSPEPAPPAFLYNTLIKRDVLSLKLALYFLPSISLTRVPYSKD